MQNQNPDQMKARSQNGQNKTNGQNAQNKKKEQALEQEQPAQPVLTLSHGPGLRPGPIFLSKFFSFFY